MASKTDRKVTFTLDLDASDYTKQLADANKKLEELGGNKGPLTQVENFKKLALAAGELYGLFKIMEGVWDAVFETDKIEKIERQFNALSNSVGVYGESMKEAMKKASDGLIDDTDQMEIANKAFVSLGENARKLPEIMELGRKITKVYGGELTDNIEQLSQAIATGNTRMLKRQGIIVDVQKAEADYAKKLGVTSAELNEQGKQAARLEAILGQGGKKFKDLGPSVETATLSFNRLKVSVHDLVERVQILVGKAFGPAFKAAFDIANAAISKLGKTISAAVGDGAQSARDEMDLLQEKFKSLEETRAQMAERAKNSPGEASMYEQQIKAIDKKIEATKQSIDIQESILRGFDAKRTEEEAKVLDEHQKAAETDDNKTLLRKTQFEKDIEKLQASRLQKEMETAQTTEEVDRVTQESKLLRVKEFERYQDELRAKVALGEQTDLQAAMLTNEAQKSMVMDLARIEEDSFEKRTAASARHRDKAENDAEGISRAFKAAAVQQANDTKKFGREGAKTYDNFSRHAVGAIKQVALGQKDASEAIKEMVIGALGEEAMHRGEVLVASSIYPPNPAGLAAGAGLIALGGVLSGLAGGGGSSAASVDTGGGGNSSASGLTPMGGGDTIAANEAPKKSVTVQVMGHYFETEQTKTRLMEMIRETTDATDYKYVQVGQS